MGLKIAVKKTPSGPVLVEDFTTGIDDWTLSTYYSNANTSWFNGNSMRHYVNTSGARGTTAGWIVGIAGNFDIEINFEALTSGGSGIYQFYAYMKTTQGTGAGNDYLRLQSQSNLAGLTHTLVAGGITQESVTIGPNVWTGRYRWVRSENDYTTYYESGSGWVEGETTTQAGWGTMYLMTGCWCNTAFITTLMYSVTVNTGTIV